MEKQNKQQQLKKQMVSELRQDLVSGDWVVIATGRAKRPDEFLKQKRPVFVQPQKSCPFETRFSNALLMLSEAQKKTEDWRVQVVPNKYPAVDKEGICKEFYHAGPYQWTEGVGAHEVVITRDHTRSLGEASIEEVEMVVRAYQQRYRALENGVCVEYISIFHNHGRQAGATITHPHSQIIVLPVIPPDINRSIRGSAAYYHIEKKCVHCVMLQYEVLARERIIYTNESFVVFAPYASRTAFEMRIFPRAHSPHFELIDEKERMLFAEALRAVLWKLFKGLHNPDYNFFFHTAPTRHSNEFDHYHWHCEILPKTAIWAGFEIGTGIEIATITPESAAEFLHNTK